MHNPRWASLAAGALVATLGQAEDSAGTLARTRALREVSGRLGTAEAEAHARQAAGALVAAMARTTAASDRLALARAAGGLRAPRRRGGPGPR